MVARLVRDQEVVGSSPVTSTIGVDKTLNKKQDTLYLVFLYLQKITINQERIERQGLQKR